MTRRHRPRQPAARDRLTAVDVEPERYELSQPSLHHFPDALPLALPIHRRAFFRVLGGGLVVVSTLTRVEAEAQESGGGRGGPGRASQEMGAWLHIAENGAITVYTGKVEVGQDIRTSLTQAVLEELPARLESVRLVMGDTAQVPFDAGTFGSRSTPSMSPQLRRVAATARQLLAARAAARFKVDPATVVVTEGKVSHPPSGRSVSFGALTKGQRLVEVVPEDAPTRPPAQWTVAGKSQTKVDARAVVTGERKFTSDLRRPGMLIGKVLRPPRFGVELDSLDSAAAGAIAGVRAVRDGAFAGVVAPDSPRAEQALAALRPTFKPAPGKDVDSAGLSAALRASARTGGGDRRGGQDKGDVAQGITQGAHRLERLLRHRLHRPRPARAAGRPGRVGGRQAHGLDRHPAPLRRAARAGRGLRPVRRRPCGSSRPTPAPATAASTPATPRWRRPAWPRRRANRCASSGPARRSSPGPTSARLASSTCAAPWRPTAS